MLTLLLALQAQNPLAHTVDSIREQQNILHYEFLISVPDTGSTITGTASVSYRPMVARGALTLDLDDAMHVTAVRDRIGPLVFHHAGDTLVIDTWGTVGDSIRVDIDFTGAPHDGFSIRQNARGRRSAFADNWPNRAHYWIPVNDHPSDKASVGWAVEVPAAWRVVANGRFLDSTRLATGRVRFRYDESRRIPAYTFVFGAAEMAVTPLTSPGGVRQSLWTFVEDSAFAVEGPFARVNRIADLFSEYIGAFPYDKLAHVQSSTQFGGMENSGAIFYTEDGYVSRRMGEGLVAHETAHQWFGDAATERDWHHLWLSEGFATYFAALFHELAGEPDGFRESLDGMKQRYFNSDVVDKPILDFAETDYMELLNANNYPKGGMVLHMLRRQIGDDAFRRGIREYYATFRDSTALSQDLCAVMQRASGQDLGWFFTQWLLQPGYPQLRVTVRRPDGSAELASIEIEQVQPDRWGGFRLPVRVDVVNSKTGARATATVLMSGRRGTATLAIPTGADTIEVDPAGDLLMTAEARWHGP